MYRKLVFIFSILLFSEISYGQTLAIKPYFGYATVNMTEVNEDLDFRIRDFRQLVNEPLPAPDHFNGNYAWGVQIEYRLEEDYFLNVSTYYFREKNGADYFGSISSGPIDFHFDREIELFDVGIGLKYFFNYSSWKRINTYIGSGVGVGLGWSKSNFRYTDQKPETDDFDNTGDFSSNQLTANITAGGIYRVFPALYLSVEVGIRFANMQQMDGPLTTLQDGRNEITTDAAFDFTGFFVTLGTGIVIPILD